ncbi:SGNH/GDSL hydrolase family protein [Candidatus Kapabacteria bacterium]|nr:SGNH/GDSL hydrolase family protein [Candidatus Kapabacteria bacterium]
MKTIATLVLINLFITFIILGSIEFGLRAFSNDINLQSTDKELLKSGMYGESFGLKPLSKGESFGAVIQSDSFGFRKSSVPVKSDSNSILIIGDSVTMGVGVDSDSTFVGKMALLLENKDVGLLNFSLIGYNIYDYFNTIKYATENYNFKKCVIFYCLNDLTNDSKIIGAESKTILSDVLKFLKSNSYLYMWAKSTFADRQMAFYEFESDNYQVEKNITEFEVKLQEIKSLLSNKELQIVILPYEYQLRMEIPDLSIQDRIKSILQKNEIEFFDLFEQLKESEIESEKLYLYADGLHFSNLGHRKIAKILSDENLLN